MKNIFLALFCLTTSFTCQAMESLDEIEEVVPKEKITYSIDLTKGSEGEYLFFEVFHRKETNKVGFTTCDIDYDGGKWTRLLPFLDANIVYDIPMEKSAMTPSKLLLITLSKEKPKYKFYDNNNNLEINIEEFTAFHIPNQQIRIKQINGINTISATLTRVLLSKFKFPFQNN